MDGSTEWQQLGMGGVFALLIIREVLGFMRKKSGTNGTSGEKTADYWKETIRQLLREELVAFESRRSETIRQLVRDEINRGRGRGHD